MWLHLEESDATGNDLVLTVENGAAIVHHREYNDPAQQWVIDDKGHLHALSEKDGVNLAANGNTVNSNNDTWFYDSERHSLTSSADGLFATTPERNGFLTTKNLAVSKENLMPGSKAFATMARDAETQNYQWRIEYCEHWKA